MARLRDRAAHVSGHLHLRNAGSDRISRWAGAGKAVRSFNTRLEDTDPRELYAWAPRLIEAIKALPQVQDLN